MPHPASPPGLSAKLLGKHGLLAGAVPAAQAEQAGTVHKVLAWKPKN